MNKALIELLKNKGSIYDYIGNNAHNLSKQEVIDFTKELLFGIFEEGMTVRDKIFNNVLENVEEEL